MQLDADRRPSPLAKGLVMECDHCRRMIGSETGHAYAGGMTLCHPTEPGEPNCFRLVTEFQHQRNCVECRVAGVAVWR